MVICISLGRLEEAEYLEAFRQQKFLELRLDLAPSTLPIERLLAYDAQAIATYRVSDSVHALGAALQYELLSRALTYGVKYVDLDLDVDPKLLEEVRTRAKAMKTQLILSYHNFERCPAEAELRQVIDRAFAKGADLVKVACLSNSAADSARILGLLSDTRPLITIGMGAAGRITRMIAPLLGSAWTYAALRPGLETAPGQPSLAELEHLYANLIAATDE